MGTKFSPFQRMTKSAGLTFFHKMLEIHVRDVVIEIA